jgi:LysR family hydrogen peroxide-inducible transcriptional activator
MVASGVGITLLPELAVRPPVPPSDDIVLIRFAEPVPRRQIAMFWRETSAYRDFLPSLAVLFRDVPGGFVRPFGNGGAVGGAA